MALQSLKTGEVYLNIIRNEKENLKSKKEAPIKQDHHLRVKR